MIYDGINIPLELIDGIGFCSESIYKLFKKQGRGKAWGKFINGSTGAISKDGKHLLVYGWDIVSFVHEQSRHKVSFDYDILSRVWKI